MAITGITNLNIPANSQNIQFFNPGLLDEYIFINNAIVIKAHAQFTLSQTDYLIHFQYLLLYFQGILSNFPSLNQLINTIIPASEYDLQFKTIGSPTLSYIQKTGNITAENLSYDVNSKIMTFSNKPSDVTISIQEFGV